MYRANPASAARVLNELTYLLGHGWGPSMDKSCPYDWVHARVELGWSGLGRVVSNLVEIFQWVGSTVPKVPYFYENYMKLTNSG